jgi:hypothetical protein
VWTLDQQLQFQQQGIWPTAGLLPNYIEDVFSTYLYTGLGPGAGTEQTITNGIDLSTKGGLTWIKWRANGSSQYHALFDTARGATKFLSSNATDASTTASTSLKSFNTNGFSLGQDASYGYVNASTLTYASWTFRKQAKFFDVVTYTGTGSATTIAHNLGSVPGCIIVKRTDTAGAWQVYHGSLANTQYMVLNTTAAVATGTTRWNSTTPTSAVFSIGTDATVNASGGTYVAYLFASNAGGFGNAGTDNVITCGSFTKTASYPDSTPITLGYEPQFVLFKRIDSGAENWNIGDVIRGSSNTSGVGLSPNLSDAETSTLQYAPLATGFNIGNSTSIGGTYIYIAIRRGPMKTPTDATKVFATVARTGTGAADTVTAGFPVDMYLMQRRPIASFPNIVDRLRGNTKNIQTYQTDAETTTTDTITGFDNMTAVFVGADTPGYVNESGITYANQMFQRAPGFFDVVCYTGTGVTAAYTHNLAAVPELLILKKRNAVWDWRVYVASLGNTNVLYLNDTAAVSGTSGWNNTTPTSTQFTVASGYNTTSDTYVAYLFATCTGVSKVGSYTGNGTTQTINCGFTGGARFVLIKRTDAIGNWYVYDTARGMTTLTDPYLLMNSTAAEVATLGSVTTVSTGFALNSSILAAINVSSGSYIFFAVS